MRKPTFEESIDIIDELIRKRRYKWNLSALAWLDYDDISQILRLHIYKKWDQYDPAKPLSHWVNAIISNQISNLIRNNYSSFSRPCLRCPAAEGENLCSIYQKQCNACPIFALWEKNKKNAYNTKLPVSLENHTQEVFSIQQDGIDIEKSAQNLHAQMEKVLKPFEWRIYKMLFIEYKTEEEIARELGYKKDFDRTSGGNRQIRNLRKTIMIKVNKVLYEDDVDILI